MDDRQIHFVLCAQKRHRQVAVPVPVRTPSRTYPNWCYVVFGFVATYPILYGVLGRL